MRHIRVLVVCALAAAGSCATPREQAAIAQALNDAANEIGGLKSDVAQLQSDLDSLRQVVAKQDTLISHIAEVNGGTVLLPFLVLRERGTISLHSLITADASHHRILHDVKLRTSGHQAGGRDS